MELRRALLLFAIVLGLAAIAASVSRPPVEDQTDTATEAPPRGRSTPGPGSASDPGPTAEIAFEADLQSETRTVPARRAATVTITAYEPGQVEIERLGLTAPVEPTAPARFDLLTEAPEKYAVTFTPVETGERRKIGVIEVEE